MRQRLGARRDENTLHTTMTIGSRDGHFHGDKKIGASLLAPLEVRLLRLLLPLVPQWLQTYHLTLLTLLWSLLIVVFSYLAQGHIAWMWGTSVMILLQYCTDLLDGAVGRNRGTGLVKWGYYMDHFLDYVFLCAILIGYSFIAPADFRMMLFFILAICSGYMVNSYLAFAATGQFQIAYMRIGPSEIRMLFVLINTLLIVFGKTYVAQTLPVALALTFVGLVVVVVKTQRQIWIMDMLAKK